MKSMSLEKPREEWLSSMPKSALKSALSDERGYPLISLYLTDTSRRCRGSHFTNFLSHVGTAVPVKLVSSSSPLAGSASLLAAFHCCLCEKKNTMLVVHIEVQILTASDVCWVKEEAYIL